MLYGANMLFTSNLKFLSLVYLSYASQLKLSCFIVGLPDLGPTFCGLSVAAVAIACIANLVASATTFAIAPLVFACSLSIFSTSVLYQSLLLLILLFLLCEL